MAELAGVPIRVFDLQADGVSADFREFMQTVPMTNDRRVPEALVDDTVASLDFFKSATPPGFPSYFVAAYIHKTALVTMPAEDRNRYLARYGEAVYPQRVCPIFVSQAGGSVPQLLSVATNLPAEWFSRARGSVEAYARLFELTEASHCGFIAGELTDPTVLPSGLGQQELRTILEALGDFEATAAVRAEAIATSEADEADVLFAARLLAMFMLDRENAYTGVPALIVEYGRIGVEEANRRLPQIQQSVQLARNALRHELLDSGRSLEKISLIELAAVLESSPTRGRPDDPLANALLDALQPAIRLLGGDNSVRVFPPLRQPGLPHYVTLAIPVRG